MRNGFILLTFLFCFSGFAQQRFLSYTLSDLPVFLNQAGDTLGKALTGGLNQPQFQALDINNDGKKDLFVYDRTGGVILPFINTGNNDISTYRYDPKYVGCFPQLHNTWQKNTWVLFVDYNNDGREDMWSSVNYKVILFRNITKSGDKKVKFQQVSPGLKGYNFQTHPEDPNLDSNSFSSSFFNIPTIADVDQDGDIDFFSYQADEGALILYRNMTKDFNLPLDPPVFDMADQCWGDFKDTAFDKIMLKTCSYYKIYRKKHTGGSTLLWFDNDNDGDMDLLLGNADSKNLIFLKNGKKEFNMKLDSMVAFDPYWPAGTTPVDINSFPAAFMLDADGDGAKDILTAPNQFFKPTKIDQTQQVWFYKNKGTTALPDFKLEKKNYFTDGVLDHGDHTSPVLYDIDNDQDLDLIIATNGDHAKTLDRSFRLVLYKNIGTKKLPVFKLTDENLWNLSLDSINLLNITIADLNGDSKPDLIAGEINGGLSFYNNIGSGIAPVKNYLSINVGRVCSPQLVDMDKDGLTDLVIGISEGNFFYCRNNGTATDPNFTISDDTLGNFITNELIPTTISNRDTFIYSYTGNATGTVTDLDGDGKYDMVFGGEEGKVRVMKFDNIDQQTFKEDTTVLFDSAFMRYTTMDLGNNTHTAVGDLDDDGIKDIIVGNDRGGISFLKGSVKVISISEIRKRNEPIVYPNPTKGSEITIKKSSENEFTFYLYDMSGKLMDTETSSAGNIIHHMSLRGISQGMYILRSVSKNNDNYYARVMVTGF